MYGIFFSPLLSVNAGSDVKRSLLATESFTKVWYGRVFSAHNILCKNSRAFSFFAAMPPNVSQEVVDMQGLSRVFDVPAIANPTLPSSGAVEQTTMWDTLEVRRSGTRTQALTTCPLNAHHERRAHPNAHGLSAWISVAS